MMSYSSADPMASDSLNLISSTTIDDIKMIDNSFIAGVKMDDEFNVVAFFVRYMMKICYLT